MAANAGVWGDGMAVSGFTDDDRRRLERADVRVETILSRIDELVGRFRDIESEIDALKSSKADRGELDRAMVADHETRIRLIEKGLSGFSDGLEAIRKDLEPIKQFHWKQLGALSVLVVLVEVLGRLIFK